MFDPAPHGSYGSTRARWNRLRLSSPQGSVVRCGVVVVSVADNRGAMGMCERVTVRESKGCTNDTSTVDMGMVSILLRFSSE